MKEGLQDILPIGAAEWQNQEWRNIEVEWVVRGTEVKHWRQILPYETPILWPQAKQKFHLPDGIEPHFEQLKHLAVKTIWTEQTRPLMQPLIN